MQCERPGELTNDFVAKIKKKIIIRLHNIQSDFALLFYCDSFPLTPKSSLKSFRNFSRAYFWKQVEF